MIININNFREFIMMVNEKQYLSDNDLHVDLQNSHINDEAINELAEVLKSGYCPPNMLLDLRHNDITTNGAKCLAKALIQHFSSGLRILLDNNNIDADGINAIVAAMKSNTSIIEMTVDKMDLKQSEAINMYCIRNKFIMQHPMYEIIIKKRCMEFEVYSPASDFIGYSHQQPPSLLHATGLLFSGRQDKLPLELTDKLPTELKEFLMQLTSERESVENQLSKLLIDASMHRFN